jgi:glycosyltransferase involved in cell wall biosynthesis
MKRLLFIGHEATRTGAPLLMLHFLQWLRQRTGVELDVLLLRGGELEPDYRAVATVQVLPDPAQHRRRGLKRKAEKLGLLAPLPPIALPRAFERHYDAVVGNTVPALDALAVFGRKGAKTVAWLHELDYAVAEYSRERFLAATQHVGRFIVVAHAVADMLARFGLRQRTDVIHGFTGMDAAGADAGDRANVRARLCIPTDAFVVGGCGTIEWRKGVDIFLQLSRRMAADQNVRFLWVGGGSVHALSEERRVRHEFERMDLGERVLFAGAQRRPRPFFAAMDVFALTSREDPFPLVCLEAAALGKPIVCFDKAGGMPEFVRNEAGAVVPYGDIDAFVERLVYYRHHPHKVVEAGNRARARLEAEFSMEQGCRRMWDALRA